jgi:hypothetical protein
MADATGFPLLVGKETPGEQVPAGYWVYACFPTEFAGTDGPKIGRSSNEDLRPNIAGNNPAWLDYISEHRDAAK